MSKFRAMLYQASLYQTLLYTERYASRVCLKSFGLEDESLAGKRAPPGDDDEDSDK